MKNILRLTITLLWIQGAVCAQQDTKSSGDGGVFFGASMSSFYRNNADAAKFMFNNPTWQWQAGVSVSTIHTAKYELRWDLSYSNKGTKETFKDNISTNIESNARLSYLQLNVFPVVYKPLGQKTLTPYIAIGGYGAYLVRAKYQINLNGVVATDAAAKANTVKTDYGAAVLVGVRVKHVCIEYKIEAGLPQVLDPQKTLSTIKNKSHVITLVFK